MTRQYSIARNDHWEVGFWLIFSADGGVRLTRGMPDTGRSERAMQLTVKVPHALFNMPTLRATIDIQAPEPNVPPIDLTAASDALRSALGCDVDVRIVEPSE